MKFNLKKISIHIISVLLLFGTVAVIQIYFEKFISTFDNNIRDYMFLSRGEQKIENNVLIVDIDEESLSKLGQWPWSRDKVARIIKNLALSDVAVIGLDVVFAELDNSSPSKVFKKFGLEDPDIPDYDEELSYVIQNTPTILGYQFELEDKKFTKKESLDIPAIIVERNKKENQNFLIEAKGTILNHSNLQKSAYSSGFFNNIPDKSGVIRSVPLIIKYNDQIYPSLALEIIRASMGIEAVFVNYSDLGVENIQIGDFLIPTDRHGRFLVNYRGPGHTFKYISAVDIYNNDFKKEDILGKIVLLGTTASGLNDLRATPLEAVFPGVEVHANIIDNIITQDFLSIPAWVNGANLILSLLFIILTFILINISHLWLKPFVLTAILFLSYKTVYIVLFEYGVVLNGFLMILSVILSSITAIFLNYIFEIRKEQEIKNKFATKVSKDVMDNLIKGDAKKINPTVEEVTIFFSNVRNFSYIAETSPDAQTLVSFLNEYIEPMSNIIIENKGTIDKFMGDSIMAYWNAPVKIQNHATLAVDTALKQLYALKEINKQIVADKKFEQIVNMCAFKNIAPLDVGIGINTGNAILGEMGSHIRNDYTIVGDSVNLGFKLESMCKYYGSKINISNFTKWQLENKYIFRYLDLITVKGQEKPIQIWEVIDFENATVQNNLYNTSREKLDYELSQYHIALNMYQDQLFKDALEIFEQLDINEDKANDKIYKIYIQRCRHYIANPPKDFSGVFEFKFD